jgi:hypothetical protein
LVNKRRRNIKKDLLNEMKRRKRLASEGEDCTVHEESSLAALEEGDEEDEDEDDISLSTEDWQRSEEEEEGDDMYISVTDPPVSHLEHAMMVRRPGALALHCPLPLHCIVLKYVSV